MPLNWLYFKKLYMKMLLKSIEMFICPNIALYTRLWEGIFRIPIARKSICRRLRWYISIFRMFRKILHEVRAYLSNYLKALVFFPLISFTSHNVRHNFTLDGPIKFILHSKNLTIRLKSSFSTKIRGMHEEFCICNCQVLPL